MFGPVPDLGMVGMGHCASSKQINLSLCVREIMEGATGPVQRLLGLHLGKSGTDMNCRLKVAIPIITAYLSLTRPDIQDPAQKNSTFMMMRRPPSHGSQVSEVLSDFDIIFHAPKDSRENRTRKGSKYTKTRFSELCLF